MYFFCFCVYFCAYVWLDVACLSVCEIELYVAECLRLSMGGREGDTFSFILFFIRPHKMSNMGWGNDACLDYLDSSHIHSKRPAVFCVPICFTNGHTSTYDCSTRTHSHMHWYTHANIPKVTHIMDVKKNCLVFSRKLGGKAAERRILNHTDTSDGKHTNTMYHYPHTHRRLRVWEECTMTCRFSKLLQRKGRRLEYRGGVGTRAVWGQLVFIKDKWIHSCGLIPITLIT